MQGCVGISFLSDKVGGRIRSDDTVICDGIFIFWWVVFKIGWDGAFGSRQ